MISFIEENDATVQEYTSYFTIDVCAIHFLLSLVQLSTLHVKLRAKHISIFLFLQFKPVHGSKLAPFEP